MARDGSAQRLWDATLGRLQIQVTGPTFDTWLKDTVALSLQDRRLVVGVATTFGAEWLEKRMCQLIERAVEVVAREPLDVSFQVHQPHAEPASWASPLPKINGASPNGNQDNGHAPLPTGLNHRYTFDTFVVGGSNQLAHAAAIAVAERPGQAYNPLFLYGGVGLGKTHLLHAIAHRAAAMGGTTRYVSCEQFTNEFITALQSRRTVEFRERYRSVDMLLMDDIQFISGKEQTQESFFHTFNALHNAGRQIVIASDRPPAALALLEERLSSRFEWGLIADVQTPALETRLAILRFRAKQLPLEVPRDVLELIAQHAQSNIRQLEGSLNRVAAFADLTGEPISQELASRTLGPLPSSPSRSPLSPSQVIAAAAAHYLVTPDVVTSSHRDKSAVAARHLAAYLLREDLHCSLTSIGQLLGGRNHATVLYSVRKIVRDASSNEQTAEAIRSARTSLAR